MKRIKTLIRKARKHFKTQKKCECVYCGCFFTVKFVKSENGRTSGCEYLCPMCRPETRKDMNVKNKESQ